MSEANDGPPALITVSDTRGFDDLDDDPIFILTDDAGGETVREAVESSRAALSTPIVEPIYKMLKCYYDPADYSHGMIAARIFPDGRVELPIANEQTDGGG